MRPRVVICGSYHHDPTGLKRLFRELESTGCRVLSPLSIDFSDNSAAVVRTAQETDFDIAELEKFHLRALREADFVMLHTPSGRLGLSGAFEIGYATALGKPVFSEHDPADEMLATQVRQVASVFEVLEQLELFSL